MQERQHDNLGKDSVGGRGTSLSPRIQGQSRRAVEAAEDKRGMRGAETTLLNRSSGNLVLD